jgi:hypothetical protein
MTADQIHETDYIDLPIEHRELITPEEVKRIDDHNDSEYNKFITSYKSMFPAREANCVRRS